MAAPGGSDITRILVELEHAGGEREQAVDQLYQAAYAELHRIAEGLMRRERPDHTLQPTALIHEAYLKLVDQSHVDWRNRAHFLGVAAQAMRRLLVDHARGRDREKRGGGATLLELGSAAGEAGLAVPGRSVDLLALDQALERLAALDPAQARLVELRFFGGLSVEEAAEALGVSTATAGRDFRSARAFLARELGAP